MLNSFLVSYDVQHRGYDDLVAKRQGQKEVLTYKVFVDHLWLYIEIHSIALELVLLLNHLQIVYVYIREQFFVCVLYEL